MKARLLSLVAALLLSLASCVHGATLWWITPRRGSLAGGTRVYLHGAGFSLDQYSLPDVVFFGNIQCDVDWFTVKAHRLECITRPHPTAKRGDILERVPTTIISGRVTFSTATDRRNYREFQYHWGNTPRTWSAFPPSTIPGSVLRLRGTLFATTTQLQSVMVGHHVCDLYGLSASELSLHCGTSQSVSWSMVCCRVASTITAGSYNITSKISNYGTTFNASDAMTVSRRGDLRMYESFPSITGVTPSVGSREGGTLLVIDGTGFGFITANVSVAVGGVPCHVTKVQDTSLECITGRPDDGSPILTARQKLATPGNISTVPLFAGNRGSSVRRFGFYSSDLSEVQNNVNFPLNPALYERSESFGTQRLRTSLRVLSRRNSQLYEAYFTPPISSTYSFFITCKDVCDLWLSDSEDPNAAKQVALVTQQNSLGEFRGARSSWDRFPGQRSQKMDLLSGRRYYMRSTMSALTGNHGFVQVAAHIYNTSYSYAHTHQAQPETQAINIQATHQTEEQKLTIVADLLQGTESDSFLVTIGGRTTGALPAINLTTTKAEEELYSLLAAECADASGAQYAGAQFDFFDMDSFERRFDAAGKAVYGDKFGSQDTWIGEGEPAIASDNAFCGHSFLRLGSGTHVNFRQSGHTEDSYEQHVGWRPSEYPHVCMGYRIQPGVTVWLLIKLKTHGWYAITVASDGLQPAPYSSLPQWRESTGAPLMADGSWHYSCYDVDLGLTAGTFISSETLLIEEQAFRVSVPPGSSSSAGFDLDEFSITSLKRHVTQTNAAANFHGVPVSNLTTEVTPVVSADGSTQTTSISIKYPMGACNFASLPPAQVSTQSSAVTLSPPVVVNAVSVAVNGVVQLQLFNGQRFQLSHRAEASELKTQLEALPGVGSVDVTYRAHDSMMCSGGKWSIEFQSQPGDLPGMSILSHNVSGTDVKVTVSQDVDGGIFLAPIPGDMLMTVEEDPQVTVTVNDIPSACSASTHLYPTFYSSRTACAFTYDASATPNATSVSPQSGSAGDVLTVVGSSFATTAAENKVLVGGQTCPVISASATELRCTVPGLAAGSHVVSVRVPSKGYSTSCALCSQAPLLFTSTVKLNTVSPASGSYTGGTVLTLTGGGFPALGAVSDISVDVGGVACTVLSVSLTTAQCRTNATSSGAEQLNADVTVTVTQNSTSRTSTLTSVYSYAAAKTPQLAGISHSSGSAGGGTVITITGDLKNSTAMDIVHVKIGEAECKIVNVTGQSVTCTSQPHKPGSYAVTLLKNIDGLASSSLVYTYELELESISHVFGSVFGGQMISIGGKGFQESSQLQVKVGQKLCRVVRTTATNIECRTPSTIVHHQVTNNAENPVYGWGYAWDKSDLTVRQGDSVRWSWTGSKFASLRGVAQVYNATANEYEGTGFRSDRSTEGDFTYSFTKLGTIYYVSEGFGHIGFRGSVTVQPQETYHTPVEVHLNGIKAVTSPAAHTSEQTLRSATQLGGSNCPGTPTYSQSPSYMQYTYSLCHTPWINRVTSSSSSTAFVSGGNVTLHGRVLPRTDRQPQHVTMLVDDLACVAGSTSNGLTTPSMSVSSVAEADATGGSNLTCHLPFITAGFYRLRFHVESLGWGFVIDDGDVLLVASSFSVDETDPPQGAVQGGTRLVIPGSAFSGLSSVGNQVFIGNTPCDVTSVESGASGEPHGSLTCITRPVIDDGYTSVVLLSKPLGYWQFNLQGAAIPNLGSLGASANAGVTGDSKWKWKSVAGIHSGPIKPSPAAKFNNTLVTVPYQADLYPSGSFGVALWVKLESNDTMYGQYRQIIGSSEAGDVSRGFSLWLSPCGDLELWLATGTSVQEQQGDNSTILCNPIALGSENFTDIVDECENNVTVCVGTRLVSRGPSFLPVGSDMSQLPVGVWSVYSQGVQDLTSWTYVSFGFEKEVAPAQCTDTGACHGHMLFSAGTGASVRHPMAYLPAASAILEIGGSAQVSYSEPPLARTTLPFVGHLAEVSLYEKPVADNARIQQYHYGTTDEQAIHVLVEGQDRRGVGVTPEVVFPQQIAPYKDTQIDWDAPASAKVSINETDRLVFQWTRLNDIVQVSSDAFEQCNAMLQPAVKTWSQLNKGGHVIVSGLANGHTHYFISSAYGACLRGVKLQVVVGHQQSIAWKIGTQYSDISVSKGTGLRFTWDTSQTSGTLHNLVELKNRPALDECDTSGTGDSVLKLWSHPDSTQGSSTRGQVEVTGLMPGWHYFVCSVPGHCNAGMKIAVNVLPEATGQQTGPGAVTLTSAGIQLPWRIQQYSIVRVDENQPITFSWDGFHSLHEVSKSGYDSCDVVARPLVEWARASVARSLTISNLTVGRHYFLCSVSGHCLAGMKVEVDVRSKSLAPPLKVPIRSVCESSSGGMMAPGSLAFCSYRYAQDSTATVLSISPSSGPPGTAINITGRSLEMPGMPPGSLITHMLITVGTGLCRSPRLLVGDADGTGLQVVGCTVEDADAGLQTVTLVNILGKASHGSAASGSSSSLQFNVQLVLAGVSPPSGSLAGGTTVTLTGTSFAHVHSNIRVTFGSKLASVIMANTTHIQVLSPQVSHSTDTSEPVKLEISSTSATSSFAYSSSKTLTISTFNIPQTTPGIVTFVTDKQSSVASLSIKMQVVPAAPSSMVCTVPDIQIPVVSQGGTAIGGNLPPLQVGAYALNVYVDEWGLAVWPSAGDNQITVPLVVTDMSPKLISHGGGERITITGSGFPGDCLASERSGTVLFTVHVCSVECKVVKQNSSHIECLSPDSPTARNSASRDFSADVSCPVTVQVDGNRADSPSNITYSAAKTSIVTSVSPRRGGTAGGTTLTLTGTFIQPFSTSVTVDGVPCAPLSRSATSILCRTGAHRTTLAAVVRVYSPGNGHSVEQQMTTLTSSTSVEGSGYFQYVDLWSSRYTWGNLDLPAAGESVSIQRGQTLILDAKTPELNIVIVQGDLLFDDSQDVLLQAKYIFIHGGRVLVGSETHPFQHKAIIRLTGHVRDPELPIYGAKVLALRQGHLELYGKKNKKTWTRLARTAYQNDTQLVLEDAVDWKHGDSIVLAPTGKDRNETEELFVNGTSADGHTVYLGSQLAYTHHGETEHFGGGHSIEIRAEVGLLTHNVIVEGSVSEGFHTSELGGDQYGSQIMIHRAGHNTTQVRLSNVEVRHCGQAFRLGRYAIHFHLSGNLSNSWVKQCSIHHSFNRAITAHGVHSMVFEGNVAYDIKGHTFFIEDGIETRNQYLNNLGMLTRGSSSLLNTDQIPATFWITNPNNIFIGNAAAGSRAYGFWYDLDPNSFGPSFSTAICPNQEKMGVFRDNVAHSNAEFGLRIWETYRPKVKPCNPANSSSASFYGLTSYANGIHGVELSVVENVKLIGFKVADSRDNGIEINEGYGDWFGTEIRDSLIVSYTNANTGKPGTGGIKLPNQRRMTVTNVTFVNFDTSAQACLRACSHCKPIQGGYMYQFQGLNFLGSSAQHKAAFKWTYEVLFKDLDGSLTGIVGGTMLPLNGLLPPDKCNLDVPEASLGSVPGAICGADVRFVRMAFNRVTPLTTFSGRTLTVNNTYSQYYSIGNYSAKWAHYRLTHVDGYMFNLVSGMHYTLDFNAFPDINDPADVESFNAGLYLVDKQDHVFIQQQIISPPDHFNIGDNHVDLGRQPTALDHHRSWHFDNSTNMLTYLLSGNGSSLGGSDELLFNFQREPCPVAGCPVPDGGAEPYENFFRYWSKASDWPTGRVPVAGQNITILTRWKMIMDVNPPVMDRLTVLGHLEAKHTDLSITASTIFIYGKNAKFFIGNKTHPYNHNATITLTGNRGIKSFALSRTMVVGAKAMAVFGKLYLYGEKRDVYWTRLQDSARKGDNVISLTGKKVNWRPGDQIVIAASGYNSRNYETVTVANVSYPSSSPGGLVQFMTPLLHDHLVVDLLHGTEQQSGHTAQGQWWRSAKMAPEVGLLTRNIRIVGGEDHLQSIAKDSFGCRVIVGAVQRGFSKYYGSTEIDGVEFANCGQGRLSSKRDPRYTIVYKGIADSSKGSFVRNSAFRINFNSAVGIHLSNGVTVENNVILDTVGSSVIVGGEDNKVLSNVAILMRSVKGEIVTDNHILDFPANFEVGGINNQVRDNAAAGSDRISFSFPGSPCNSDGSAPRGSSAKFWDNTAHGGLIGLKVVGVADMCTAIGGFTVTHHWDYGIFSWTASSLVITDVAIAVGHVGVNLNVFGPDPVQHLFEDKSVKLQKSLIVGELPNEASCSASRPPFALPSTSFSARDNIGGVMMSTFSKTRGKMNGIGKWHLPKSYPGIRGRMEVSDVAFARFYPIPSSFPGCPVGQFAVMNNDLSPDAMHPLHMERTVRLDVGANNLAFMYPPKLGWINQEDCVDMDCDGPKHSIVLDLDGTFTAASSSTTGRVGSIVPRAELRFDQNRLPIALLADATTGILRNPADVSSLRGIARGFDGNLSASMGGCEWRPTMNSYQCSGLNHAMLVLENMDADTEVRRISPLVLRGGDTGRGKYDDLMNGPMDHGWCTYYTCLKRLSTFFSAIVLDTEYELWMTGSNPTHWRFHLLNAKPTDSVSLKIWFKNIQRKDIYKDNIFIEPENVLATDRFISDAFIPDRATDISGANYFDVRKQFLHLVLKGTSAVDVVTAPVVTLSFNVQVSLDDFFDPQHIVTNIAGALGVDLSTVRLVDVVSESSGGVVVSGRKRRATASRRVVTLEVGSQAAVNRTDPPTPTIAEQIADGNVDAAMDDVDLDANSTVDVNAIPANSSGQPTPSPILTGGNITDSPSVADLASAFKTVGKIYSQQVDQYAERVNSTNQVNQLGAILLNKLVLGLLVFENATILNASIGLAQPPPVPSLPTILPPSVVNAMLPGDLDNITASLPPPATLPVVDFFQSSGSGAGGGGAVTSPFSSGISVSIPARINVFRPPADKTGHLVYTEVEILDTNSQRSTAIGVLGDKWTVTASLDSADAGVKLEGKLSAIVTDGVASFTRLRVNRVVEKVKLVFTVSSGTLSPVETGLFDVKGPAADIEREAFLLKLGSDYDTVIGSQKESIDLFRNAIISSLSSQLDIDPSRIENVEVQRMPFQVLFKLVGVAEDNTTAPDVPTLKKAVASMQRLIQQSTLSVIWPRGNVTITAAESTEIPEEESSNKRQLYIIIGSSCAGAVLILLLIIVIIYHGQKKKKNSNKKVVDEFLLKKKASSLSTGPSTSSVTAVTEHMSRMNGLPRHSSETAMALTPLDNAYAADSHQDVFFKARQETNLSSVAEHLEVDISKSVASISDISVDLSNQHKRSAGRHPLLQDGYVNTAHQRPPGQQQRRPLDDMDYHHRQGSRAASKSRANAKVSAPTVMKNRSASPSLPGGVDDY
eukprot:scpid335/ scgid27970/ Fibrocystin-L; Polycystic kidney and hepatic disease 1-like protein 1